ncbi:sugar ABC transporter permease, partial [Micromonospora aurantiaca]|nr:sugar ABC transporter permease [Micromonospora aurantiaca]
LLGAVVSVGAAFLGALGIGGLRPLGRRSEWLLLPFAPWLFVGIGPLSIAGFENVGTLDLINSFGALIPPML